MSEPSEFPQSSPTPPPLPRRGIAQPWSNEILGRLQQSDKPEPDTHRPQPGPHRAPQNMEPQTTRRAFTDPQTTRRIVKDEQTTRVMPQGAVPAQNPLPLHPPQTVATPPLAQTTPPLAQATPPLAQATPMASGSLRSHREYEHLSGRHAVPRWRRFFTWFARVFRSDDTASRVARASAGAQRPVTTGRRIVIVGASGGVGSTSVATGLAMTLAAVRNALVAFVASGASDDLEARLNIAPLPRASSDLPTNSFDNQLAGMSVPQNGRLAAVRPHSDTAAMSRSLGRYFAITVVDAGREPSEQLVREAHALVVVGSASASGEAAAVRCAARLRGAGATPQTILVALIPRTPREKPGPPAQRLRAFGLPAAVIPYDRHIAGGAALRLNLASEETQVALGELAAAAMTSAR